MLAFDAFGRGPRAVVLLHGWPLDRTIWEDVGRRLARAGLRVWTPDLPGFGGSPGFPDDGATVEAFADAVASFLRESVGGPAAVAGHSFGGYVVLALAERAEGLLAGLGLVSSRTIPDTDAARRGREEAIGKVRRQGTAALLPGLAEKLLGPHADAALRERASEIIGRADPDAVVAGLRAMARRPDRTGVLEAFARPVLVLHGTDDALIPATEAPEPRPADGRVVKVLPDVGHMPMWEAPRETVAAIAAWAKAAVPR